MGSIKYTISSLTRNKVSSLLKQGKRADGRGLMEFREFKITPNLSPKAEGSVDCFLGDTRVMTGVKYEIGRPYDDNPDQASMMVMAELVPIASPFFEAGRPTDEAIQLARVVDRGIRHSECIDLHKLCIKEKEAVYTIIIDNYVMDHFGNMVDCAAIASIAALINAKIPSGKWDEEKKMAVHTGEYQRIPIANIPVSVTFAKIDGVTFVDPSLDEELVADGLMSIAVDENQNVTSIQKYLKELWSVDECINLCKKALEIGSEIREKLNLWQYAPKDVQ